MAERSGVDPEVPVASRLHAGPQVRDGLVAHDLSIASATVAPVVADGIVLRRVGLEEQCLQMVGHLVQRKALSPNEVQPSHLKNSHDVWPELGGAALLMPARTWNLTNTVSRFTAATDDVGRLIA